MSEERVLVTGAAGFVGRHLTRDIEARHPDWRLFRASGPNDPACDANYQIQDGEETLRIIKEFRPTKVVHLAAVTTVRATIADPRLAWDINLYGTLHIALGMQKYCPGGQLLLISSAEIYGTFTEEIAVDESFPILPLSPYAASKASAELLIQQVAHAGLVGTIARPFTHAGPGQSDRFAFPAFAKQIAAIEKGKAEPVLKVGNLNDYRDITDVRDIVDGYIRLLERSADIPNGTIVNLSSGKSHRMGDLLDMMLAQSATPIRVEVDPSRLRQVGFTRTLGDASKAARLLDWRPRIPIEQTLRDILEDSRACIG